MNREASPLEHHARIVAQKDARIAELEALTERLLADAKRLTHELQRVEAVRDTMREQLAAVTKERDAEAEKAEHRYLAHEMVGIIRDITQHDRETSGVPFLDDAVRSVFGARDAARRERDDQGHIACRLFDSLTALRKYMEALAARWDAESSPSPPRSYIAHKSRTPHQEGCEDTLDRCARELREALAASAQPPADPPGYPEIEALAQPPAPAIHDTLGDRIRAAKPEDIDEPIESKADRVLEEYTKGGADV